MIQTVVPGQPVEARWTAEDLRAALRVIVEVAAVLQWAVRNRAEAWSGPAGEAFAARLEWLAGQVSDLLGELEGVSRQLDQFADQLTTACELMASARTRAVQAGLAVTDEGILPPAEGPRMVGPVGPPASHSLAEAYRQCEEAAAWARRVEDAAHADLQRVLANTCAVPVWQEWLEKAGVLPPRDLGTPGTVLYGSGLGIVGAGVVVDWATKIRYGRFVARDAAGRFVSTRGMGFGQKVVAAWSDDAWQATARQAATRGQWLKGGKLLGPAGGMAQGGIGFLQQWKEDADDPALSESERVGRAGAHALIEGGGSWALAAVGAKGGGAFGFTIGGPPGAVAGAAIGGIVGGVVGSELGGVVADRLDGVAGEAAELVTGGVKDLGRAVKFW